MDTVKTASRMREASESGQKPPTDANATRQRYQLGCHAEGASPPRAPTKSRQFNRGSGGTRRQGY
jgi:hypothetical protein